MSRGTAPADRVDAELRYALAAPLISEAALWVDLGCGTGVAAGVAFGGKRPRARALLVDHDAGALADARGECGADVAAAVRADLETAEGLGAVRQALADAGADDPQVVTCFHVLQQLSDFTGLVELLIELGGRATVVLSVPDDAAGALDDPHRRSAWSAGAAEELRRLLPPGARSLRQVGIRGGAIVDARATPAVPLGAVEVPADVASSDHLLAFGPAADRLAATALARVADVDLERADARRRESDLAYLEARLAQLEAPTPG